MSFAVYDNDILLCTGDSLLTYDTQSGEETTITLTKLRFDAEAKVPNNVDAATESYHGITSVLVSNDGTYFCVCTNRKQLCLYKRSDRTLISNRTLARAASKARFTPKNDLVVADKSGDAYLFSTERPQDPGTLILGHLSMLLDILISRDNEHVVTTDRDEKIRVSLFPNSYNIVSYCLGHKSFVTAVAELPWRDDILASVGGDGRINFWNYKNGKELASFSFADKISQDELENLNKNLRRFELTENAESLPVKHLQILDNGDDNVVLAISFFGSGKILAYAVSKDLNVEYLETIIFGKELVEILLHDGKLWILNEDGLVAYRYDRKKFYLDTQTNTKLERINERWRSSRNDSDDRTIFPILYKRKFDNIQEYRERKKSRLGNT